MSQIDSSQRADQNGSKLQDYPSLEPHREDIFITVKTYPRPSKSHRELVCTVGITKKGKWIRLYPIDYRYMHHSKQYHKNQWINVEIEKNTKDFRIDSYRPNVDTITIVSNQYDSRNDKNWEKRKEIIIPTIKHSSIEDLEKDYKNKGISLGIFKPRKIVDFMVEEDQGEWGEKQQLILSQLRLFDKQPKQLEKIPFRFRYKFLCQNTNCLKPHSMSIIDWEIFALYRGIKQKYPYAMDKILEKIRMKWVDEMWSNERNTYLIVGTQFPNPTFMVLGVFWPPKD